jgi:hypothetical protein
MRPGAWILVVAAGLILTIFVAGFFSPRALSEPCAAEAACKSAPSYLPPAPCERAKVDLSEGMVMGGEYASNLRGSAGKVAWSTVQPVSKSAGLLALTASPNYKRAAELSLKVEDCTKAEDALEARLEAIKGEILDMLMEGTEGSRTCTLSVLIPADKFREFVVVLRKMGKVQAEKITASKLKPGEAKEAGPVESKDGPDPRELSIVAIRMADEKVAQTVLESRGLLASSFDRSASHFMNGMATLVEALGYFLPYFIGLSALLVPLFVVARLRRAREVRIQA